MKPLIDKVYNNSKRDIVRQALDAGETLTPMIAISRWHITKLATLVSDLKRHGYPVVIDYHTQTNKNGFASYRRGPGPFNWVDPMTCSEYRQKVCDALVNTFGVGNELAHRLVSDDYGDVVCGFYHCDTDAGIASGAILGVYEAEAAASVEEDAKDCTDTGQIEMVFDKTVTKMSEASDDEVQKEMDKLVQWAKEHLNDPKYNLHTFNDEINFYAKNSSHYFKLFNVDGTPQGIKEVNCWGIAKASEPLMDADETINYIKSLLA